MSAVCRDSFPSSISPALLCCVDPRAPPPGPRLGIDDGEGLSRRREAGRGRGPDGPGEGEGLGGVHPTVRGSGRDSDGGGPHGVSAGNAEGSGEA